MPAKDLGAKYTCFKCGTKFYDMKKPEPLCPKCGADQRESPALKAPSPPERRPRTRPPEPKPPPVEVEPDLDEDVELEDDDDADEPADDKD
jgi:predicted  nucleic acid-binding Zn-ribbon protein